MNTSNEAARKDAAIPPVSRPLELSTDIPDHLSITGSAEIVEDFKSEHLNNLHNIDVYLPPQYSDNDTVHYPVLYTIGWNTLFITGSADPVPDGSIHEENESIVSLLKDGVISPFIMISVSPDLDPDVNLMDECAPTRIERTREIDGVAVTQEMGGKVHLFAKFLIDEVKPWVDARYRTLKDGKNTGITGISKWGMGTLYIAMNYPKVFGMVGGMSPALSWDSMVMAHVLDALPHELEELRVWMVCGELEGHYLDDMSLFERLFISKGVKESNMETLVIKGADHSGQTWGPSVGPMLRFMFGEE